MASSSDHESDTDELETVEGMFDDLTHVFGDSSSGASDCGDNGSDVLDEHWSPGENVTIENTDETRVKDGGTILKTY